jgi:hypothetical protein
MRSVPRCAGRYQRRAWSCIGWTGLQNALDGIVANCVSLGQSTSLDLQVDGAAGKSLYLSIPTHLARRNGIAIGQRARVSLLVEGIHLMPWEDLREHPTAVAA